jgi:hypothetical protein
MCVMSKLSMFKILLTWKVNDCDIFYGTLLQPINPYVGPPNLDFQWNKAKFSGSNMTRDDQFSVD